MISKFLEKSVGFWSARSLEEMKRSLVKKNMLIHIDITLLEFAEVFYSTCLP